MLRSFVRFSLFSAVILVGMSSCNLFRPTTESSRPSTNRPPTNSSSLSSARLAVVEEAEHLLGTRYKYGGNTPREGFDCSGFTVYAYQQAGLRLPRTSHTQSSEGNRVRENDVQPGDLVYYSRNGRAFHVSLVVEATRGAIWVIHATSSRGVIRENILASSYWKPKISGYRNVLGR